MRELESPRRLRPLRGWRWIVEGIHLVRKKPVTFAAFFVTVWLTLVAASQNQLLMIAVQVFLPAMLAGGFRICEAVDEGNSTPAQLLTSGFRRRAGEFIALGALYFLSNLIVTLATVALGGQELVDAMANPAALDPETRDALQSRVWTAMMLSMVFILPLQMALWFAPTSVALSETPVGKALLRSLQAIMRNWLPFLVYGAVIFGFSFVLFRLFHALGLTGAKAMFATISILVPGMVPTIYTSYKDVLGDSNYRDLE